MITMVPVLILVLFLGRCAAKANLSPTSRVVLFCNPLGPAVDLALVSPPRPPSTRMAWSSWDAGGYVLRRHRRSHGRDGGSP
jgi:hypothetical protein